MSLKLYYDLMSQPSRALYVLLKTAKCNFQPCLVDLRKGQHVTEDYAKFYKLQKVPVIDHGGFVLGESIAIIKYLSREGLVPDSLYPSESKAKAKVDEFLEWHHIGLRLHLSMYFRIKQLEPLFTGKQPEPARLEQYQSRMESALKDLDEKWLGAGEAYLVGNKVSVADLWAACEVEQPRMTGYDPTQKFANIGPWMQRVREHFGQSYAEAHVILNKIVAKKTAAKL